MRRDLFVRHKRNPIITPGDLPFNVNGVLNPGWRHLMEKLFYYCGLKIDRVSLEFTWREVRMV
jgi:hypothetical protein